MNLPNKLTVLRLILSVVIIVLLVFPFYAVGIQFPTFSISCISSPVESQYFMAGIIFIIASVTDFLDGRIARKYNLITDTGKMLDAIADKVLVNSVLIILAAHGFINEIIPVIIVLRDIVVNAIKMEAAAKGKVVAAIGAGKIKTSALMIGVALTFFDNWPFELININVNELLLYFACVMSIISAVQYFNMNKKIIFPEQKNID